jgi:hypothetical protein
MDVMHRPQLAWPAHGGLKPIGTIASYWALHCSCLVSAVQIHTTTHCKFNREQFDPAPPKAGPWPTAGKSCLFYQKPRSRMQGAKIPIECDNGAMKFLRADVDIFNLIHLLCHALCSSDRDSPRFLLFRHLTSIFQTFVTWLRENYDYRNVSWEMICI